MRNKEKNKIKVISIIFISFLIIFCNCTPALAGYINYNNDKVNIKEKQLLEKIKIIHQVFPKQTDEAALLATLAHRGTLTSYINDSYDPNFDKDTYRTSIDSLISSVKQANTKASEADLLLAATIVMVDSSGGFLPWASYSDEKYKKALAGNKLFGTTMDNDVLANGFNILFCAKGAVDHTLTIPVQFGMDLTQGQADTFIQRQISHYITMKDVCTQGYIGGTYSTVKTLTDDDRKQAIKDQYAEEIIHLAELFRGEEGNVCLTGNTQTGDLSSVDAKACGEKFGSLAQAEYSRTGVFASVTLAQAWLESNCGKATPPNSNNLFGIKCSAGWTGKCSNASTSEFGSGGYYTTNSGFRVYDSVEASIADHSDFLTQNSRYAEHGAFTATNYADQIKAIHNAGYATDPNYASRIISIIQDNGFDKWDVITNTTSSSNVCSPVGLSGWTIRTVAPTASDSAFLYEGGSNTRVKNRGQCVWYAKGRAVEIVEELGRNGKLSEADVENIRNKLLQGYGAGAGEIYDNTKNVFNGSSDIRQPKSGSYIVWKKSKDSGHVAIVEEVNTMDNTITITEGWSNSGNSCPNDWSCVSFQNKTFDLDEFYNGYGKNYIGGYNFSGYVYFLEPIA